jgi:AcrR family transcriptional regulator
MSKKPTTTKEAMLEGAFRLVREKGHAFLTARNLAAFLGCSTQPIMYQFPNLDTLRELTYQKADAFHSEYILAGTDLLEMGLHYIRFAEEEPQLFRFLFQSGYAEENSLLEMVDSEERLPILAAMKEGAGLSLGQTKSVFITVALFAHGYASIIANNHLEYDEQLIAAHLERAWNGAVLAAEQEENV